MHNLLVSVSPLDGKNEHYRDFLKTTALFGLIITK